MHKLENESASINELEDKILKTLANQRDKTAQRFPLGFGLAASFGLVSTFYGFEGLINKVDLLKDNPWAVLATGVTVLVLTGTAYRKLN